MCVAAQLNVKLYIGNKIKDLYFCVVLRVADLIKDLKAAEKTIFATFGNLI